MTVYQNGPQSLLVSWTPSEGENLTGYTVFYYQLNGNHSDYVETSTNSTTLVITDLISGALYSVSIVANSSTLPSTMSTAPDTRLGMFDAISVVALCSTTI